jgi:two-component system sensor histidine kinase KdpD
MFLRRLIDRRHSLRGYLVAACYIFVGTLLTAPLHGMLDLSNVALLYVLAVVLAGVRYGRGVAIFSALFGSLVFAYVFVPPHFSLAITEVQYLLSAVIMLVVALLVGHVTATLRTHSEVVEATAVQNKALYEFARQLTATRSSDAVIDASLRFLERSLAARRGCFVEPGRNHDADELQVGDALIQSSLDHKRLLTRPTEAPAVVIAVLPLLTSESAHGALCFLVDASQLETQSQHEFLETVGSLVAVALERTHYAEAAQAAELRHAAESLRNTILASLSHDIRTPLTALVGTADTLMLAPALSPEKQRALLAGLREQAQSIFQFVNNLLDMTRLQSGNVELNLAWQPIEEVVGATLQQIRSIAGAREIGLSIAADLPPVLIDAVLVERALWNLLENAVKYSPDHSLVELDIRQSGEAIDIAVCDRGEGLPSDDAEALFGLFQRGHAESNIPGAGLGLAIVKSIAEAHHGRLSANQRVGGGSCFHLILPLGKAPCLGLEDDV